MTSIVLVIVGWLAGWWLLWRVPTLVAASRGGGGDPRVLDVAVVVPARDEAANLPGLLRSLAGQAERPTEVVVVDDGSDDDTASVARALGATVLPAGPAPRGWTGKAWACQQGADATRAPTIVFLDADVRLEPHGLAAVVAAQAQQGGLVSVAPHHRMGSSTERLSAPFNLVSFMGVGSARPGRKGASDGAFGPCMVCDRSDYEAVGGHGAAGSSVTEDLALARAFEDHRLPTTVYAGRGAVDYRMYPGGLGSLVEGWSKNVASGARFVPALRSLAIGLWIVALLVSVQLAVTAAVAPSPGSVALAAGCVVGCVVQQRVLLARLTDAGWGTAIAYPVTTAVFVAVFLRSVWLTMVRRQVSWRGRTLEIAWGDRPRARPGS